MEKCSNNDNQKVSIMHGMNRRRALQHWGRGFESHLRHGCLVRLFSVRVFLCVGSGLVTG
jgi:hypothetical protein